MNDKEYELMKTVGNKHWFWVGRQRIIEDTLRHFVAKDKPLAIADAGCGFGNNFEMLQQFGHITGLELNDEAREMIHEKWGDRIPVVKWKSPEPLSQCFDLILMADVLEHIENDAETVNWIYAHLNPGGYALLTVPAHQFLWTEMDEVVHHYRRYTKKQLVDLFEGQFKIVKASYYNMILFPVKVLFMLLAQGIRKARPEREKRSYNDLLPGPINATFKQSLYLESRLLQYVNLPYGVAVVGLFQKQ